MEDYTKTKAFWLLREWVKEHAPKGEPSKSSFIVQRTNDLLERLQKDLAKQWESEAVVCRSLLEPIPDYGDHMTMRDWLATVNSGGFIDYDGHGHLATKDGHSGMIINPTDVTVLKVRIPDWATHVVWYNR